MTTIAVIGATGTLGRHIVEALGGGGHDVRGLGRGSRPVAVDLASGVGLHEALAGCEVVVDASNGSPRRPEPVLVEGARRLTAAAVAAGVAHLVCVSVVGIEDAPGRYYRAKLAQERIVTGSGVPWSIVRSTQFHELIDGALSGFARWRLSPRSAALLQPVAAAEVGRIVADAAMAPPSGTTLTVGGPSVCRLGELAQTWASARGRRGLPVPIPLPPSLGRPLRAGVLTCPHPDRRGEAPFSTWLTAPS
jgi:uncharacterized protein YbjT (DUF2867 family)